VWGAYIDARDFVLCWDWAEIGPGIVALARPLEVFSNVALVSPGGEPLSSRATLLELNSAVHQLDWQRSVCESMTPQVSGASIGQLTRGAKAQHGRYRADACSTKGLLAA
jgi:hypothetical protein